MNIYRLTFMLTESGRRTWQEAKIEAVSLKQDIRQLRDTYGDSIRIATQ
jgi:hypothetical protein